MTDVVEKSVTDPAVDQWGSFMPALLTILGCTNGPVLEIGVGHYSTPVLHAICRAEKRELISLEESDAWEKAIFSRYCGEGHSILPGKYDEWIPLLAQRKWSVALLDHSPGDRRATDLALLAGAVDYFVVHDFHAVIEAAFGTMLTGFNFHVTRRRLPPTLVASRLCTIPDGILAL